MKLVGRAFKGRRYDVEGCYVVAGYIDEFMCTGEPEGIRLNPRI